MCDGRRAGSLITCKGGGLLGQSLMATLVSPSRVTWASLVNVDTHVRAPAPRPPLHSPGAVPSVSLRPGELSQFPGVKRRWQGGPGGGAARGGCASPGRAVGEAAPGTRRLSGHCLSGLRLFLRLQSRPASDGRCAWADARMASWA